MTTYQDFGTPTDTLAAPSLSEWAAAVAAELDTHPARDGGVWNGTASIPSSATANNALTVVGSPTVWGGVTSTAGGLLVGVTGWYRVTAAGTFATSGTGTIRALYIYANGVVNPAGLYAIGAVAPPSASTSGLGMALSAAGVWQLSAGDALAVRMRQDSGGALTGSATLSVQLIH